MDEAIFVDLLKKVVENHGCRIVKLNFKRHLIKLVGSDETVITRARAIADLVGK